MNFQEDFQFLLKILREKNDTSLNASMIQKEETMGRIRKALVNVINFFISDFDKISLNIHRIDFRPMFGMLELYIQQYSELFITIPTGVKNEPGAGECNVQIAFTNYLLSKLIRILANTSLEVLHSYSSSIIITLLNTLSVYSSSDFYSFISEFILSLDDLIEFDHEFYDKQMTEAKILKRLRVMNGNDTEYTERDINIADKPIVIETPGHCDCLQNNITVILNDLALQFMNGLYDYAYEIYWRVLCKQLDFGDYKLKINTFKLILSTIDLRILPKQELDLSDVNKSYFFDCLLSSVDMLLNPTTQFTLADKENPIKNEFDEMIVLIIIKIFDSDIEIETKLIDQLLNGLNELFQVSNLTNRTDLLRNGVFYLTHSLATRVIIKDKKLFSQIFLLIDVTNSLVEFIGKFDSNLTYLNWTIAQVMIYEIQMNNQAKNFGKDEDVNEENEIFAIEVEPNLIKTDLYKKLINKAKQFLQNIRQAAFNEQELNQNAIGLNSVLEILNHANFLCQRDNCIIEEAKNIFIENASGQIFAQLQTNQNSESLYLHLISYWLSLIEDQKNQRNAHLFYIHALNTIKSMFLTSVEWKKNLVLSVTGLLSLPWLVTETNGLDFELFKDKVHKQCSTNLLQSLQSNESALLEIKCFAISLLCLIPKQLYSQWRIHLITKCFKDKNHLLRKCSLKYLPYLIHNLGVISNSLIFQLIHPTLTDEKNIQVLRDYSNMLRHICCLISRKCFIYRTIDSISESIDLKVISYEEELGMNEKIFANDVMTSYFKLICTCCDKHVVDTQIKTSLKKPKNLEFIESLMNRPKFVDSNILIQFFYILNGDLNQMDLISLNSNLIVSIKTRLLYYIERSFNHLEFPRFLNESIMNGNMLANCTSSPSSNTNSNNLTFLFKEAINLFSNESVHSLIRAYFARFTVPKIIHVQAVTSGNSSISSNDSSSLVQTSTIGGGSMNSPDLKYDHNFNLEMQLCEGFRKSKIDQSLLNEYLFIISLGRLALSLKCDEYLFVTIKNLIEIFDSNDTFASSLAQQQLLILSKHLNMQELISEFTEKVCEIISDTIYNSLHQRHQQHAQNDNHSITMDADDDSKIDIDRSLNETTATASVIIVNDDDLKDVNYSLKDLLKVFNITDSCFFIRSYQKYLLPMLICKANQDRSNYKLVNKSIEFLARKLNLSSKKLIEDNFPHLFVYTSLNSKDLKNVFTFIASEANLIIDKLILNNQQRLFNELLSRCGDAKYKLKVWHAIRIISTNDDQIQTTTADTLNEKQIAKLIEPNLLAALIHFDMCLMRSSINVKEKCQVLESLNTLISMLGVEVITKVRYKIMTTLKLAMKQCSKYSELNCKLWDTFIRNVHKQALGPILNQISVNLLQLLELQPYKISKIFEYLIINNSDVLQVYFSELYFIPEHQALQQINQMLYKYTNINYILDKKPMDKKQIVNGSAAAGTALAGTTSLLGQQINGNSAATTDAQLKALISIIKHYLKGALHENADLRVKALQQLYTLFKEKSSQIIYLIQRQENSDVISEIILALLNGCRDTDVRAKLLFGCCLGEIGALDPANVMTTLSVEPVDNTGSANSKADTKKLNPITSNELLMNPSLVGEDSNEFSEMFSYSLIIELSKAYLAARNTHEQDSASYGIQEALKIYGCSAADQSKIAKIDNKRLWDSFPDYIKEILTPLRTSKYEIQSFENFSSLKTPIILCENECKSYEEWCYKWTAYLISKLKGQQQQQQENDKELQIFPKLAFIIRFNVNVALFILPYIIIKIIMLNYKDTIDQIYEELMSVIKLSEIDISKSSPNGAPIKMVAYKHICCQTVFNIYDHLMRQLNYYRTKLHESQAKSRIANKIIPQSTSSSRSVPNDPLTSKYRDLYELFNKFITRIPQQILSKASLDCKAYCRALMHYELSMRGQVGPFGFNGITITIPQVQLNELQNIYATMDEIDASFGILVLCKGTEESLYDVAFRHKITGKINESIACLEKVLETTNKNAKQDFKQHETFIRTFISVGRHRNALSYLEGLMNDKSEWNEVLNSYRVEACWKLGSWDKLKQIITTNDAKSTDSSLADGSGSNELLNLMNSSSNNSVNLFNAGIGKLFCSADCSNESEFYNTLAILREQQIVPLSAVSMESGGGSYQRGYEYVVNLQILKEIENCLSDILKLKSSSEKEQYRNLLSKSWDSLIIEPWERRVESMQPSFKYLEPIYNVRISLLTFLAKQLTIDFSIPVSKLWLRLAKIARKAGMFENAYQYMLNAQSQILPTDTNNLEELLIEKSKWYWQHDDRDSALFHLNKGLNELFNFNTNDENHEAHANNELYSKVLLMYTKFSEENGSLDSETIRKNYLKVQKMCSKVEQSHFQLAQFIDRLGMSVSEHTGKKEKLWEYLAEIVGYYGTSLEYGCQYIYQSLPRMITLWLDFGADYYDMVCRGESSQSSSISSSNSRTATVKSQLNVILNKLNSLISNAISRLPTYTFLTVYPQLVSRICHPEEHVFDALSNIIMKVLFVYPTQAIWMLIAVKNSSVEFRRARCKLIVDKAIKQRPDLKKFISDSSDLAEKLVQLGNLNVDAGVTQLSLSSCFKPLKRLVESKDFSKILIPSQFQCTLQLPSMTTNTSNANASNQNSAAQQQSYRSHNPYPLELVYIHCFEDQVSVMNSLQKPKKVTIRGTDGKLYSFLCKAKDDLRIDYRIQEFFSVVNKCLKREPEARRRNLYIRTYAVTPLNEFCGIIEWIENLATLRSILVKLYSERNLGAVTSSEWRTHEDKINRDKEYALKVFRMFIERYKPTVLYEWFLRTFPEPNTWYNARSNYVRTAAVMSICGYVLGLGDRHCENILMESSNGDCIHVDFNCLFNKGETLGVPEIVPFRLTHNMIEAMGPLGYEGMYRKVCEVSLRVIREYRESLITILKTFIYDPLVEWKAPTNAKTTENSGETISAKGQIHLQNITSRLKGMHAKQWIAAHQKIKALPLSVEGQVNSLIKEATDERSLSAMYIGWAAFY